MRWAMFMFVCALWGCSGGGDEPRAVIRLVDEFPTAAVLGSVTQTLEIPRTEWTFSDGDEGWKARSGVTGFAARNGKLTGRTQTALPALVIERTEGLDEGDVLHEIVVEMRVSAGANLGLDYGSGEELEIEDVLGRVKNIGWRLRAPIEASDEVRTFRITPGSDWFAPSIASSSLRHLVLSPTDAPDAEFEIESVRLVFRKEHLASIPAGVSWQGLRDIFRETLVTRAPERVELEVSVPENAFFELALGTLDDGPATFLVRAETAQGESVRLLEKTLTTPHRWEEELLDLDALAGQRVTLTLSLQAPEPGKLGFWGAPAIRARAATRRAGTPQGVIVVLIDTLRRDHLPMYGYHRDTAPHLARLAAEGALFSDAIAQGAWTKVSVTSFLTSTYPTSNGISDFSHRLPASATTLAEAFREAGYATWHSSSVPFSGRMSNLHQGVEVLHEEPSIALPDGQNDSKTARALVDRLLPWLEAHRDVPFYAFLHAMDPHDAYRPYRPYDTLWAEADAHARHEERVEKVRPLIEAPGMKQRGLPVRAELEKAGLDPDAFVAHELDCYDGSIRAADAEIGRVLEKLDTLGLSDDTLVVFLSDHGEEFLDHGGSFHEENVYGELVNVPLVFRWPSRVPAGLVREETVQLLDMAPTVLELSGIAAPETMQGRSLVPLLSDGASEAVRRFRDRPAISEWTKQDARRRGGEAVVDARSIILDGWKLVHNFDRPEGVSVPELELFDHRKDPLDLGDVAHAHPDIVARLKAQLDQWHEYALKHKLASNEEAGEAISSEELDRLRSLGYVQ